MDDTTRRLLESVAREHGTPCYVYFIDRVRQRFDILRDAFGGRFKVSYAVKANPNVELLKRIEDKVATLDVSSGGEVERALAAGYPASRITFSGPVKRDFELRRSVEVGVGELVCESVAEMIKLNRFAEQAGRRMSCLIRINPKKMPRNFMVNMAKRASQFCIDEEDMDEAVQIMKALPNLHLNGFHIYSGTNCMVEDDIAENFEIFIDLFHRFSEAFDLTPEVLVFGSGFGIPYLEEERPLDIQRLAALINPKIDAMKKNERLREANCFLEMGRWLVGLEGYLLLSVINEKRSRGTEIRMCDAGFNNHLAACGMMGSIIRRNWRFWKINSSGNEPEQEYHLVGPLCTSIDTLAMKIKLPELHTGDVLAIGSSGAYGFTASPTRFISHPEPQEFLVEGANAQVTNITEHWSYHQQSPKNTFTLFAGAPS